MSYKYNIKSGLPWSGKKLWKKFHFPGLGKVMEFHFQSGKLEKMKKNNGKVREFQFFPQKMFLVSWLLEIIFPLFASNIRKGMFLNINCEQFMRAIYKLPAIYVQKHAFSNIYGMRFFFQD